MKILIEVEIPNREYPQLVWGIWDLIELFYPDYYHSETIAVEGDLIKLIKKLYENGDRADDLLQAVYNGDINNPQILIDSNRLQKEIYEDTINAFISNIESIKQI